MERIGNCLSSLFLLPAGSSRRPDVGGLPRKTQLFEQALARFLVTIVDVAEVLLGQVQLGCELGQRLVTLDALHDGDQLFDGRRFVCHTGIQRIPFRDTASSIRAGPDARALLPIPSIVLVLFPAQMFPRFKSREMLTLDRLLNRSLGTAANLVASRICIGPRGCRRLLRL